MKKTIIVLLSLAFVLSFSACKSKGKLSGDTKLIPEGTNAIAEINFTDIMKLAKVKKELEGREGKSFTKKTGLKPSDIKSMTLFATVDKLKDLDRNPNFGFLVKGSGFDKAMKELVKSAGKNIKELKYAGTTVYTKSGISLSLTGNNVAGGTLDNVKKVLDLSKGKGKAVNTKEFSAIFSKLNASSAKGAVILPKSTRDELVKMSSKGLPMPVAGLSEVVAKLDVIAAGANISSSSIELKLVLKSDSKAVKTLVSTLNGLLKTMAAPMVKQYESKMKGVQAVYDSLKIKADGDYLVVSVKIPASMLDKM